MDRKGPIDADITIRAMRGEACDLAGMKDPGKGIPTERLQAPPRHLALVSLFIVKCHVVVV
jgi:hypothetical protein